MNLNKFAEDVHRNAAEHGWWNVDRSFAEVVALCHSELSEALEEYRDGRPLVWKKCEWSGTPCHIDSCGHWENGICNRKCLDNKPEGIAVEMADCIIRILDWCGKEGLDIDGKIEELTELMDKHGIPPHTKNKPLGEQICGCHYLLSLAYQYQRISCVLPGSLDYVLHLAGCIKDIMSWAMVNGIDMESVLLEKHEYNKGRPYRHGGKLL